MSKDDGKQRIFRKELIEVLELWREDKFQRDDLNQFLNDALAEIAHDANNIHKDQKQEDLVRQIADIASYTCGTGDALLRWHIPDYLSILDLSEGLSEELDYKIKYLATECFIAGLTAGMLDIVPYRAGVKASKGFGEARRKGNEAKKKNAAERAKRAIEEYNRIKLQNPRWNDKAIREQVEENIDEEGFSASNIYAYMKKYNK